jgi:hypothetical protein
MDAAGFMWVIDGYANYNPGHQAGSLNSVVAIVHGLLLFMLLLCCLFLSRLSACSHSMHGCQLPLERHRLCGLSPQFLEPRSQLPANAMPL